MIRHLKISLAYCLFAFVAITDIYGQLEKVKAHYDNISKQAIHTPTTLHFVQEADNLVEDFDRLSQIVLIRHGEPTLKHHGFKTRREAQEYIIAYDKVGVHPPNMLPLLLAPDEIRVIHTSSLNRSISTAEQVFWKKEAIQSDTLFREFERKILAFPNIPMPHKFWLVGSRVLWYLGLNDKGIESRVLAQKRAKKGAEFLEEDAFKNGKTVLVAHGFLNRYLEKHLKKRGWTTVYSGGNGYLSQRMMVKYRD